MPLACVTDTTGPQATPPVEKRPQTASKPISQYRTLSGGSLHRITAQNRETNILPCGADSQVLQNGSSIRCIPPFSPPHATLDESFAADLRAASSSPLAGERPQNWRRWSTSQLTRRPPPRYLILCQRRFSRGIPALGGGSESRAIGDGTGEPGGCGWPPFGPARHALEP